MQNTKYQESTSSNKSLSGVFRIFGKPLFNLFLWSGLLLQWTEANGAKFNFGDTDVKFEVSYQMAAHLQLKMLEIKKTIETAWGQPLNKISLQDILEKAQQGDQNSKWLLTYLYLDKQLKYRNTKYFSPNFEDITVTKEDMKDIRDFLQKTSRPYEWEFIEGWTAIFSLQDSRHIKEKRKEYLNKGFSHFLKASKGKYKEFSFSLAFFILETQSSPTTIETPSVQKAKNTVLRLAEKGYPPAQYLQGLMELQNNNLHSALHWFEKSYASNFLREACSIVIGWFYMQANDSSKAIPYLKTAIYKYNKDALKPKLFFAYINQEQVPEAFKVAKEIAENYTRFSLDINLMSMNFIISTLFKGEGVKKNWLESYTWIERARLIAADNNLPVQPEEYTHFSDLSKQLSLKEKKIARIRARQLYHPARNYSEMDVETSTCDKPFH